MFLLQFMHIWLIAIMNKGTEMSKIRYYKKANKKVNKFRN